MATEVQFQKLYGNLRNVQLPDLQDESASLEVEAGATDPYNRMCGCPDHYDGEVANASTDELAKNCGIDPAEALVFKQMHASMEVPESADYATKWSVCYPSEVPGFSSLYYFLDLDTFPAHYKRPVVRDELERIVEAGTFRWKLEQLLDECLGKPMVEIAYEWFIAEAYRVLGCKHIKRVDGPNGKHNIHVSSRVLGGSVIGRAQFPSGSCGDHLFHHIDSTYKPDLIGLCKLGTHEFGHGHGEEHQFSGQGTHHGVMSYSPPRLFYGFSTGVAPHKLPKDPSLDSLIRKYGGKEVPLKNQPTPVPTPTPTPTPGANRIVIDPVVEGTDAAGKLVLLNEVSYKGRTFILQPKPFT